VIHCLTPRVLPLGGDVPRDKFELFWTPNTVAARGADPRASPLPQVFRVDGGRRDEVSFQVADKPDDPRTLILTLDPPPEPGTQLALDVDAPDCGGLTRSIHTSYMITDSAPVPSTLGTLEVSTQSGPLDVGTISGSCSVVVGAAYADLKVALADAARP
jgi:hypothetical protein